MKDKEIAEKLQRGRTIIEEQLGRIIVGQKDVIEQCLIALFSKGHALLVGVPGLAKTLLVSSLSRILDLQFQRVQFTPDLMPSDVTGFEILQEDPKTRERVFRFSPGPIFTNMLLADEINRTPPKTQSALLQAMQEYQVSAGGETRALPEPFFVLATHNPIEQEGTYPLPEAQLDRFFLQIRIGYPSEEDERRIVATTTGAAEAKLEKVLSAKEVLALQDIVRKVPVPESVVEYAVALNRRTRPGDDAPEPVKRWVQWGAGPRGSQALVLGAKARALLEGRFAVSEEDVRALAKPILRHRVVLNFQAEADGTDVDDLIEQIL